MFSELVVAYLFLGGTGAGALLIAAVLMLLADRESREPRSGCALQRQRKRCLSPTVRADTRGLAGSLSAGGPVPCG